MPGIRNNSALVVVSVLLSTGAALAAGDVVKDCDQCPELVVIPAGAFMMGTSEGEVDRDDDEGPARTVTFTKPFALGKYEVTFEQWDACASERGCEPLVDEGWGRGKRPVINMNHQEALAYARWLSTKTGKSYRLPSEAEWEYSARAGGSATNYWGTARDTACATSNIYDASSEAKYKFQWKPFPCTDGQVETAPVGSFAANAFGLHDMLGNVFEWTADCYLPTYAGAPSDGYARVDGSCFKRVSRGGSWNIFPQWVRATYRYGIEAVKRSNNVGFRVARDLP